MNLPTVGDRSVKKRIWSTVPFEPYDLPKIASYFKKVYQGHGLYGNTDLFHWKIIDNYIRPGIINLVKEGDQIVSIASVTPKRLFLKGQEVLAAETGDNYTDPKYQRQGMFELLVKKSTQDALDVGISFIYGTPNSQSLPGYEKKANYKTIPEINIRLLALPINVKPFIQKHSHWLIGNYMNCLFSTMIYPFYLLKRIFSSSRSTRIEEFDFTEEGWDDFWGKCFKAYDFILSRDRAAIKWRYYKNPNKYRFYVLKREERIVGYVVYRIIHDVDVARLVISDFLFIPGHERDLRILILKIMQEALHANVTTINVWCPRMSLYYKEFKKFGFIDRGEIPVICFQNDFALNLIKNCRAWHFTVSDSDNI